MGGRARVMSASESSRMRGLAGRRIVRERIGERAPILFLLGAGAISLAVAIVAGILAARTVGTNDALEDVQSSGEWIAYSVGEPNLSEALIAGDQKAVEDFDRLIRTQVLSNVAVRVKLWSTDGRIIYSDEPRLIGRTFGLRPEESEALQNDETLAAISENDDPANEFEADLGPLLQVYVPVQGPGGERLLFEMYFAYDVVTDHTSKTGLALLPIILASLFVVGIIHVPVALNMSTHLRRHQIQREGLLRRAIEASELERRRVAADLHDGVIQELAAASIGLAAVDELMPSGDYSEVVDLVRRSGDAIRASIGDLRSLVVDIYPPRLREQGIESVIADLLDSAADAGLATSFETQSTPDLAPEMEVLAYRTVRESVQNTLKHANARTLRVTMSNGARPFVVEIVDDGNGFSPDVAPGDGHLGLRLLSDLATDLGAELSVVSTPGNGTLVRLEAAL